jgi:nicotinamidase-related amidase
MPPPSSTTAIILIDPYNDFLHPSGKITPALLPSLTASSTVAHLQTVVRTARAHGIPIFYCLHQPTRPGFLVGWRHSTALQQSQRDGNAFEEGSWGAECLEGLGSDIAAGDVVVSKHWSSRYG